MQIPFEHGTALAEVILYFKNHLNSFSRLSTIHLRSQQNTNFQMCYGVE